MRTGILLLAFALGAWGGMPDSGSPPDSAPSARPSAAGEPAAAGAPATAEPAAQPSSSSSLIEAPQAIKPGDTTEVKGGGPAPSVDPRLQGRAALPDSVQDAPLLVPGAPTKPPPGNENSPGTGR